MKRSVVVIVSLAPLIIPVSGGSTLISIGTETSCGVPVCIPAHSRRRCCDRPDAPRPGAFRSAPHPVPHDRRASRTTGAAATRACRFDSKLASVAGAERLFEV